MTKKVTFMAALLLGVAIAPRAHAQQQVPTTRTGPSFGIQAALAADGGDIGVGGRVSYPFRAAGNKPLQASAYVNWFPGTVDVFDINWDLAYMFAANSSVRPYVGAGLNFSVASGAGSSSEFGLNAVGGVEFNRMGRLLPFVEARYTFFSLENLILSAGVRF